MAKFLGEPRTKLYRHVRLLEQNGLLEVAETRRVSGIDEKLYRVTTRRILIEQSFAPEEQDEGRAALLAGLDGVLDQTRSEIRDSLRSDLIDLSSDTTDAPRLIVIRAYGSLSAERAAEFAGQIQDLMTRFSTEPAEPAESEESPEPDPDVESYALTLAFYPVETKGTAPGEERKLE